LVLAQTVVRYNAEVSTSSECRRNRLEVITMVDRARVRAAEGLIKDDDRAQGDVLSAQEIYRFSNGPLGNGANPQWDVQLLWDQIRRGLAKAETPVASIGVDAWGVDYALLDEYGALLQNPFHHRHPRNPGAMREVLDVIGRAEIYQQTGIQFPPINTLYQLYAGHRETPDLLRRARKQPIQPRDCANAIVWLCGGSSAKITGHTIHVDGGLREAFLR
jgi:hypothetical protein